MDLMKCLVCCSSAPYEEAQMNLALLKSILITSVKALCTVRIVCLASSSVTCLDAWRARLLFGRLQILRLVPDRVDRDNSLNGSLSGRRVRKLDPEGNLEVVPELHIELTSGVGDHHHDISRPAWEGQVDVYRPLIVTHECNAERGRYTCQRDLNMILFL